MKSNISDDLRSGALVYHSHPKAGKLEIVATKPLGNQRDLALAYSPGVAAASEAIAADPARAFDYTVRGNLVGVVSNGTAVLGLGNIGPLAAKPVMEGKAVLFKKFAGIDVFDIEVSPTDVEGFCNVVAALEPTFGGINLEDVKAPECFEIEEQLRARMHIPVFHDDQHGTAIIVGAAVTNGLSLAGKPIGEVKIVASGAGAAALACLNMLVALGARRENIWIADIDGVVYEGREAGMDRFKAVFAQRTRHRHLADIIEGADVFLGLSAGGVLKPEMVERMAPSPLILALANPTPEIMPEEAVAVRPDAVICTGRSDYPNQVNNVLCFPYIFRGALDVGATTINEEMKLAAVRAIAELAREPTSDVAAAAYGGETHGFGPKSIIPTPFDPRLILRIAPAVAEAAMATGVATRPLADISAYYERLDRFVFRSGFVMKPMFERARRDPRRVVYAEGEDERVLRAVEVVVEEGLAHPILIGRPEVVMRRIERFGLTIRPERDFDLVNPEGDPRYKDYVETYLDRTWRAGITADLARTIVRTRATVIAALSVHRGEADAMLCGLEGRFNWHQKDITDVIGLRSGLSELAALSAVILNKGVYFLADTNVRLDPDAEGIAEIVRLAAEEIRRFGIEPRVALLSHSNFGTSHNESSQKMRRARDLIRAHQPDIAVEGEMRSDVALDEPLRQRVFPRAELVGEANLLVMPNLDAASIAFHAIRVLASALPLGPILLGVARPAHILTASVTARGVVNMTAIAVAQAQALGSPARTAAR
ncbi:MAG: NADP-dependent malic enzyme [Hyphomicrobiaceae bacterium]